VQIKTATVMRSMGKMAFTFFLTNGNNGRATGVQPHQLQALMPPGQYARLAVQALPW
jgi:hypothetical protein